MSAPVTLTFLQMFIMLFVNLIGVGLIILIIVMNRLIPKIPNKKIIMSIGVGLIMPGIFVIALLDGGIYLWINSGNYMAVFSLLPFSLCIIPILFPSSAIVTFIQLSYGEKSRIY